MVKNQKNFQIVDFDSSKEGFYTLNAMQKISAFCKVPFRKNQEKTAKIVKIFQNDQKHSFSSFSCFFSEMVLCREMAFFALLSVHQNPSFELSKSSIRQFL